MYSKQKHILLLLIILRYPIDRDTQEFIKIESHIFNDIQNCPNCFQNQTEFCKRIQLDYQIYDDLTNNINILLGVRQNRFLRNIMSGKKIVAKYLARNFDFSHVNSRKSDAELVKYLSHRFLNESRLDGLQYCPTSDVKRFVNFFAKNFSEVNIWMHMNVDVQPLLLPYLYSLGFPVPETYATCGFTIFQSVAGVPLANLYSSDFLVKIKITKQLLLGALKFSEGFNGFKIYITDLNMDNVVYNDKENTVSFVDLNTVFIVDVRNNSEQLHKHEFLECYDCFAFSPSEICYNGKSDINIFAVCQFLQEDLRKNRNKGFLYPVPEEYSYIEKMLSECVNCMEKSCHDRYDTASEIIQSIDKIIRKS